MMKVVRMGDPILSGRLDILQETLERIENCSTWLGDGITLPDFFGSAEMDLLHTLRRGFNTTIAKQARDHMEKLREIRTQLTQADHRKEAVLVSQWHDYNELYKATEETFSECLTFIGGLNCRTDGKARISRILIIADELIRYCADVTGPYSWRSLTVPALNEAINKTLAHIIRIRLREWTIWSLPLVVHEFGHIMISESEGSEPHLKRFIDTGLKCLIAHDTQQGQLADKQARLHLDDLLADAFATCVMGPAYACAAIQYAFNPSVAYDEDEHHPSYAKRALVVITIAKEMNKNTNEKYGRLIYNIENAWSNAVLGASGRQALVSQHLIELSIKFLNMFPLAFLPSGLYVSNAYDSWTVAENRAATWAQNLQHDDDLSTNVCNQEQLRDVLNAAWQLRFSNTGNERRIEKAAERLCEAIIEARYKRELKKKVSQPDSAPRK